MRRSAPGRTGAGSGETVAQTRRRLAAAILESPATAVGVRRDAVLDAEELVELACRGRVPGDAETLDAAARRRLDALVERRLEGEPMALIRGGVDFRGLRIAVRPGVFAPRPSSEQLAMFTLARLRRRPAPVALDVACGAGALSLAIAHELSGSLAVGADISPEAVAMARSNARRLRLGNARFVVADLLDGVPTALRGRVDVITIHPPYVARRQMRTLPRELVAYEPHDTLTDGSSDGLHLVRRLATEGRPWLSPRGWMLVEIWPDLARAVASILRRAGMHEVRSLHQPGQPTRVVAGRRAPA